MELIKFNSKRCDLCKACIEKCPFGSLSMEAEGIQVNETCRMCGICVKTCPQGAIRFEQKAKSEDKSKWNGILVYAQQEHGKIHPVVLELIHEARKLASQVSYDVFGVIIGGRGTRENGQRLLEYGLKEVFVYEHEEYEGFKADSYTDAATDCIAALHPSVVLVGATEVGRSLAPRLSTRFHTGLTADCTQLLMRENTDLVQIRPAFGGNIMAQILITEARPQFATVRYKVMETAEKVEHAHGKLTICPITDAMVRSKIHVLSQEVIKRQKGIEEEEVLIVAGRGVKGEKNITQLSELARMLGGQLCFTRPMVEQGYGDSAHQIGLSGRTVKPKLIITCGVSGAIQFTSCMNGAQCIIAINNDPEALIFNIAHYCIVADLYQVVSGLLECIGAGKEV